MPPLLYHPGPSRLPQTWLPELRRANAGALDSSRLMLAIDSPALTQMKGYPDRIQACTTTHFDGVIAVIDPETSWVGRWQRICTSSLHLFTRRH